MPLIRLPWDGGKDRVNFLYYLAQTSRDSLQCSCACCDLLAFDTESFSRYLEGERI
jgi:hypothetical protein